MKYILHVDINSFFASVEELNHPSFKNKPIAVSGYTKRSVVCSANYIAREYGIKAAMPVFLAQKLCPGLTVVVPHFDQYHKYSERFTKFISEKFTNKIELGSIDECYVNITSLIDENHSPIQIAENLQKWIKNAIGLNCSIGIANNKFLAKMASDYKKPLGITTL
jgi:DNA polymerase-4